MKIFISYPPIKNLNGTPLLAQNRQYQVFHNPTYIYPMVAASAATLLQRKGHQVIWNDCIARRLSYQQFLQLVDQEKPDLIAMESKTPVIKQHWQVIKDLKQLATGNWQPTTVLMGDHVTALPEESMRNSPVDFVITGGDYDFALLNITEHLERKRPLISGIYFRENNKTGNTGRFELKGNLDDLPLVDRDLTQWKLYGEKMYKRMPFTYTMAGRDCPWAKCSFCSWTTLYPNFRVRSVENFLSEIDLLIGKYRVREIFDDTGTFPSGGWLKQFCQGMISRGYHRKILFSCNFRFDYLEKNRLNLMKRAGFRLFKLGLESANETTLQRLNKGTSVSQIREGCALVKQAGLQVHLTVMLGYPWENKADALKTVQLARDLMQAGLADMLQATIVIPYPGTPLYQQAVNNDWFKFAAQQYQRYDMQEPVLKTADLSAQELMQLTQRTYSIFWQPRFILRHLSNIRSWDDLSYLLRGATAVLGHLRDFNRQVNAKR